MSNLRLVLHQFRFDRRRFRRDPAGLFYAFGFPLVFLVMFLTILGSGSEVGHIAGRALVSKYYYLPGVIDMGVVSVAFVNLTVSLTSARERGTLKRVRGTPVPAWVFFAGRIATVILAAGAVTLLATALGSLFYGVAIPGSALVGALLALVVAAAAYCCLAFAATVILPSSGAAAALTMTLTTVLFFLSGLYARNDVIPSSAQRIGDVFPVKPLFASLAVAFDPTTSGIAVRWSDLAIIAAWGLGGLLVAFRFFRWEPRSK